ncbi:Uncharacterised protein [Mycobacteroides abscessus subsp. abscessus]|nr:Uncharacterised protein [Mycobacteroides abscessus subsp. abscessus]
MPSSRMAGSRLGASSAYTDAGPPDRMIAAGSLALNSSIVASWAMTSE